MVVSRLLFRSWHLVHMFFFFFFEQKTAYDVRISDWSSDVCSSDFQCVEVGPEGVLYSFSTVHVSSSQPVPYTIGYVDFPGDVRVLAKVRGPHQDRMSVV